MKFLSSICDKYAALELLLHDVYQRLEQVNYNSSTLQLLYGFFRIFLMLKLYLEAVCLFLVVN